MARNLIYTWSFPDATGNVGDALMQRGLDGKMYEIDREAVQLAIDEQIPYSKALQRTMKQWW